MFVKRALTISQIQVQLEILYYPNIRDMIQKLSIYSIVLVAGDDDELQFLDTLSYLREELILLEKWEMQVLFPKLLSRYTSGRENLDEDNHVSIQTAYKFVRVKRARVFKLTQNLRVMCNDFVADFQWSETKRKCCEGLFAFYESILHYMNFEELTISPEIYKLLNQDLNNKVSDGY